MSVQIDKYLARARPRSGDDRERKESEEKDSNRQQLKPHGYSQPTPTYSPSRTSEPNSHTPMVG